MTASKFALFSVSGSKDEKLIKSKHTWTISQTVARIADHTASQQTLTCRENYLCVCSAFPIQSCIPNLKPLAQAFFEILRLSVWGSRVWPFKAKWRHRSCDHSIAHIPFPIYWFFRTKPLSLTVSEIFNVKCNAMVAVTLIRPLNKSRGHSFWYQSIFHIRLPIGSQ